MSYIKKGEKAKEERMERKLVKQGRGALTVTLPAKWLESRSLIVGSTVSIEEENDFLVVRSSKSRSSSKITLDFRHTVKKSLFYHIIQGKYVDGFDEIEILHQESNFILEMPQQLLGFAILEHSKDKTVLKNMLASPEDNFDVLLRRSGHQLASHAKELISVAKEEMTLDDYRKLERLLDIHLLYCMRFLSKYHDKKKSYRDFLLCATFEAIADQLFYIAQVKGLKLSIAKKVALMVESYVNLIFAKDFDKLYMILRDFRDKCPKKTYLDGLVYSLAEMLYNNIGYLVEVKK